MAAGLSVVNDRFQTHDIWEVLNRDTKISGNPDMRLEAWAAAMGPTVNLAVLITYSQ